MTPQQYWATWLIAGAGVLLALTAIVQLVIWRRARKRPNAARPGIGHE